MPFDLMWSAAAPPTAPAPGWLQWLLLLGDPSQTVPITIWWGGILLWVKVIALFSLVGWLGAWVVSAIKERAVPIWLNAAALAAVLAGVVSILLMVMQSEAGKAAAKAAPASPYALSDILAWGSELVLAFWAAWALWSIILKVGNRWDALTLLGTHLALAGGVATGFAFLAYARSINPAYAAQFNPVTLGVPMGATFMGYVILARILGLLSREVAAVRPRRLYAIAWQTVIEANRRMWAPWVVLTIFLVVMAFIHWFLTPPRPAELGRLFVGTLALLGSLLLTVMVMILTPISLPNDIQQQTIYTIVSKPVRRIELVWGRMIGFMVLVTALLAVFGGVSLAYLNRTISRSIVATREEAARSRSAGSTGRAIELEKQAEQMATRMAARVPIKGSLIFFDSKGAMKPKGVNVGMEMESRSHIEGASRALALWRYDVVPDALDPQLIVDRRVPVSQLLRPGTIEDAENRLSLARRDEESIRREKAEPRKAEDLKRLTEREPKVLARIQELEAERDRLTKAAAALEAKAAGEEGGQALATRKELAELHSPPIPLEMTFNIFRTTKGQVIGAGVHAEVRARNLQTGETVTRLFPVREYYTNRIEVPSRLLVGSAGRLSVEVRCLDPQQYLGMAESDLYILQSRGSFAANYIKGLSGVWLQAMVLTAIGVWAGTFLSWPVALLMTIFFFVAGQVAFGFLQEFALLGSQMQGGGPFESLIRLLSHENMQSALQATPAVLTAKTLDALVTPIMARLVYIVPNFAGLDVSNTVAEGFDVDWRLLVGNFLGALAYALPFSIAGYFILKNREVAA